MPTPTPWRRREAIAALAVLVALGCSREAPIAQPEQTVDTALTKLRRGLRKHVRDKPRRARAMAKVDELEGLLEEIDHIALRWRTESHAVPVSDATTEQLLAIADLANADVRVQLERAVAISIALRGDLTPEEWRLVFPPQATRGDSA